VKKLLDKYENKLVRAGLADPGVPLLGGLDDTLVWNRPDPLCSDLGRVFEGLNINSLLFARPAEPYWSMISLLASESDGWIHPGDCETRTFLHDIPVVRGFDVAEIVMRLRRRKSVVVPGMGVMTWGTVSPEQAFIFFSSVCFSCFVKFLSDCLVRARKGAIPERWRIVLAGAPGILEKLPAESPPLLEGPFQTEGAVRRAIVEAGRKTVELRLVDSFFGNISYLLGNVLYISQTTSSLDELEGAIDPCPMDGSACTGITASSEYSAHVEALERTGARGVLHGHPKFSVIMSMICEDEDCGMRGSCHIRCPKERFVGDVPIVPGEVGTGPFGLCNTLPRALVGRRGAIVYGHGLFTLADRDFNIAFRNMIEIERMCRERFFSAIDR
jgi:ribulose-5-phosphate 4-epimerase/fuculose-1-phosphate aldolase